MGIAAAVRASVRDPAEVVLNYVADYERPTAGPDAIHSRCITGSSVQWVDDARRTTPRDAV